MTLHLMLCFAEVAKSPIELILSTTDCLVLSSMSGPKYSAAVYKTNGLDCISLLNIPCSLLRMLQDTRCLRNTELICSYEILRNTVLLSNHAGKSS